MSSVTTVLQFCFVVLHCTFIYVFFNIIAMIDSVLLRIAGKPIGQIFFWAADCFMSLLIDAASYPITKKQNFNTSFFLPAFIIVQWVRITSSLTLFLLAGRTISSKDMQGVLESVREMLQDAFSRGRHHSEQHRRPSFSMRLLNIKTKEDSESSIERSNSDDGEKNEKTTYSDSNTQTTVHFSPDTSINSEPTSHLEQNDNFEICVEEPTESKPSENVNLIGENLDGSVQPEDDADAEQQNFDNNSEQPIVENTQMGHCQTETQNCNDNSDQSSLENTQKEYFPTETQHCDDNSDQSNTENQKEEHCQYNEQQCY